MKIGIDISQIVHEGQGVARYAREMVTALVGKDKKNEYILFGASLRKRHIFYSFFSSLGTPGDRIRLVVVPIPPTVLTILWNRLHWVPVSWLIGRVDIFWSSDWTQPPLGGAVGVTTIHDVSFLKVADSFVSNIRHVQKQRLRWVKTECQKIFCDSAATQEDVVSLLGIAKSKTAVIYPGI